MKKLYLLLDEWDNDRNFVGKELELISDRYDVTVICNSATVMLNPKVKYSIYKRPRKIFAAVSLMKMLADPDAWREIGRVFKEAGNRAAKLSETVRFYINADMFRSYMKKRGFFEDNVIYYSYWYFWKCYAVTHEIDKFSGSRVITRTHEYDLYDYTSPSGYQPFKESMDDKLDAVVFIAEHGMDYYLEKYHKEPGKKYKLYRLGTAGNAVWRASDSQIKQRSKEAETINRVFTLVSCSSIIERKRVYRIVEALGLIDDISIRWFHFGSGEQEDEIRKLSADLIGNKQNIEYELKGYVRNEELHDYYRSNYVDAFVTASSSEGNPVSVMEAMSYGIPVIAPSICNFPNMIKDCGITVPETCEAGELADAIRKLANMTADEITELRDNARKCWDDKFNADRNNRRFVEEVLDKLQ